VPCARVVGWCRSAGGCGCWPGSAGPASLCTRADELTARRAGAAQYAKIVQRLDFPATFKDFKVQNIVGSCDVRFPIRLEGLSYSHGMFCSVRARGARARAPNPPALVLAKVNAVRHGRVGTSVGPLFRLSAGAPSWHGALM